MDKQAKFLLTCALLAFLLGEGWLFYCGRLLKSKKDQIQPKQEVSAADLNVKTSSKNR